MGYRTQEKKTLVKTDIKTFRVSEDALAYFALMRIIFTEGQEERP